MPRATREWVSNFAFEQFFRGTPRALLYPALRTKHSAAPVACRIEAVTRVERTFAADEPRAVIQAATGAGKTFTACAFSCRLLEHAKFHRILFLADRANLVRQARDEFMAYRPPGTGRSFTELYNVQRLGPAELDKDAAVVIATIQRVYSVLSGRELSEEEEEASAFEAAASEVE